MDIVTLSKIVSHDFIMLVLQLVAVTNLISYFKHHYFYQFLTQSSIYHFPSIDMMYNGNKFIKLHMIVNELDPYHLNEVWSPYRGVLWVILLLEVENCLSIFNLSTLHSTISFKIFVKCQPYILATTPLSTPTPFCPVWLQILRLSPPSLAVGMEVQSDSSFLALFRVCSCLSVPILLILVPFDSNTT